MDVNYYQFGIDFAEYCKRKHQANTIFDVLWEEYARFGLFERFTSEPSMPFSDKVQLMKGLGYGNGEVGILFSVNVQIWACIMPLLKFDHQSSMDKYIQKLQKGEIVGAHAISEPEVGSDVFGLTAYYEKKDDGYHLSGSKCFVSNAPVADVFLVYARKKGASGLKSISCFLIDKNTAGVFVGRSQEKMGMNSSPFGDVTFDDCVVPNDMIVGKEGQGMNIFNYTMLHERPLLFAFQIGIMEKQFDDCLRYVKSRKLKGNRLLQHESVSNRIADMKTRLYISNLVLDDCVESLRTNSAKSMLKSSMAKLSISEMLCENCMDAMRNYGTFGYVDGYNAASQLKDTIGGIFYSGTSDIQRSIIASLV